MTARGDVTFSFDSYELTDPHTVVFHYAYHDEQGQTMANFAERYKLPCDLSTGDDLTRYILQQLHLIVGVSYYKSLLGQVRLPYTLDASEATYWNAVYDNGLGEYAYLNKLTTPITPFQATEGVTAPAPHQEPALQGALLGIGGGKDSIVAGEIFKGLAIDTITMDMASGDHHGQAGAVMDVMGLPQMRVERYLDTSIIDFTTQHQGNNGHIPLSAILAWLGVLLAYTNNRKYVLMANEAAASVGNTTWNGRPVNHQWSKSLEFEQLTQGFIHQHVSPDLFYLSPIRPYGSLAVMLLFTKLAGPYFEHFTSCNLVLRIDPAQRPNGRWCTHCAKCLSTWLLLSLALPVDQLQQIFGRNLFDDESLRPLLRQLLGLEGHKPLDCVGTTEELRAVTRAALEGNTQAPLLQGLTADMLPGPDAATLIQTIGEHAIPAELFDKIAKFVSDQLTSIG